MYEFDISFERQVEFDISFVRQVEFGIGFDIGTARIVPDPYTGNYEITPTSESQTIEIKDKMAVENITVAPIPSNYGLITWDGGILTVS